MAIHANSTPMPGRPPSVICPAVGAEQEFLALLDLRERTTHRLEQLLEVLLDRELQVMAAEQTALPLSGLVQAQPNVLLFKGGRDVQHSA